MGVAGVLGAGPVSAPPDDEWALTSPAIEGTREACRSFIVAVWVALVATIVWRGSR